MRFKWTVLFVFFFFLSSLPLYANDEAKVIDKLDQISDEILQMVRSSRYEDAEKLLDHFSQQFLAKAVDERTFTMDELRIVTVAHNEATEAVKSTTMEHTERVNTVTKFRLVVDAVSSTEEPLWTEMEEPILTVFGGVKEAVSSGDNEDFHSKLNSFLSLYDVIYPSMKLDIDPTRVQKLDAQITFIDNYRPDVITSASSQSDLEMLEKDLRSIFNDVEEDDADPSLWWVIITTGSIIIVTLTYVGWRKYKGHKEGEKQKKPM